MTTDGPDHGFVLGIHKPFNVIRVNERAKRSVNL